MVKVTLSTREIEFKPDNSVNFDRADTPADSDLDVTVTNTTQQFVSFHIALAVKDQTVQNKTHWYLVEPNVCAKKPPGDRTKFSVKILRAPVPSYNTTIPLIVKIFSAEMGSLSCEEIVYLKVSKPDNTVRVNFPFKELSIYPGDKYEIPILVSNLESNPREVTVRLENEAAKTGWFTDGEIEKNVPMAGGESKEVFFEFNPPNRPETLFKEYGLDVRAKPTNSSLMNDGIPEGGSINIRPYGQLAFQVGDNINAAGEAVNNSNERVIPTDLINFEEGSAEEGVSYALSLTNLSNLDQKIHIETEEVQSLQVLPWTDQGLFTLAAGNTDQRDLRVCARQPLLGWSRNYSIQVTPTPLDLPSEELGAQVVVEPDSQVLKLKVKPIVPFFLQLFTGFLGICLLWWMWFFFPRPLHTNSINTVRFSGGGHLALTGASDRTLRKAQVNRSSSWLLPSARRPIPQGQISPAREQAIRVFGVLSGLEQVAIGLENGDVELFDVAHSKGVAIESVNDIEKTSRVFDLDFAHHSLNLFGGYGSGHVQHWQRKNGSDTWKRGENIKIENSTVYSLAVSRDDEWVAIAGRHNRLFLWKWNASDDGELYYEVAVPPAPVQIQPIINRNNYLTSVDFSGYGPLNDSVPTDDPSETRLQKLAIADNRGWITVFNMQALENCMGDNGARMLSADNCSREEGEEVVVAQWQASEMGSAIREISLTDNGCYLASTGDDGHISLWRLSHRGELIDKRGNVVPQNSVDARDRARIRVDVFNNHLLNSVDVHLERQVERRSNKDTLFVAADTPNNRLHIYRKGVNNHVCN